MSRSDSSAHFMRLPFSLPSEGPVEIFLTFLDGFI